MHTRVTLHPGQRGAKKLFTLYGDRLLCVRYRYDEQQKKRFKTIELIVEEGPWDPKPARRRTDDQRVRVRVALPEVELRNQVKHAGGRWDPHRRLWELRYEQVVALGLEERIVEEQSL
jgi:hypothetical protein